MTRGRRCVHAVDHRAFGNAARTHPRPLFKFRTPRPSMRFAQILAEQRDHTGGQRIPRHGGGVEPGSLKGPLRRRLKLFEQRIRRRRSKAGRSSGTGTSTPWIRGGSTNETGGIGKTCIEPRPNA